MPTTSTQLQQMREQLKEVSRNAQPASRRLAQARPRLDEVERELRNAKTSLDVALRRSILDGETVDTSVLEQQIAALQNRREIVAALVGELTAAQVEAQKPVIELQEKIAELEEAEQLAKLDAEVDASAAKLAALQRQLRKAEIAYQRARVRLTAFRTGEMQKRYQRDMARRGGVGVLAS